MDVQDDRRLVASMGLIHFSHLLFLVTGVPFVEFQILSHSVPMMLHYEH